MDFCRHCAASLVYGSDWSCAACHEMAPYQLENDEKAVCVDCEMPCDSGDKHCFGCGLALPARVEPEIDGFTLDPQKLQHLPYQALLAPRTSPAPPVRVTWITALKKYPVPVVVAALFGLVLLLSGATVKDGQGWSYACPAQAHILLGYDFVQVQTADAEDGAGVPDPGAAYFRCKRHAYKTVAGCGLLVLAAAGLTVKHARRDHESVEAA